MLSSLLQPRCSVQHRNPKEDIANLAFAKGNVLVVMTRAFFCHASVIVSTPQESEKNQRGCTVLVAVICWSYIAL